MILIIVQMSCIYIIPSLLVVLKLQQDLVFQLGPVAASGLIYIRVSNDRTYLHSIVSILAINSRWARYSLCMQQKVA